MTTNSEPTAVLGPEVLRERAEAVVPLLRENAARTERERQVVAENVDAIKEAGLFRLSVPKEYGGHGVGIRAALEICAELGRGCGSTSWIVSLLNSGAFTVTTFPEEAQREVFADPDGLVCGVILGSEVHTERVEGGYLVSGRWGYASGSHHSRWALLGRVPLPAHDGHPARHGGVLLPMSELTVEDTWHVAGMCGTGSNTLVADKVFAPDHRVLTFSRSVIADDLRADGGRKPVDLGLQVHAVRRALLVFGLAAPLLGMAQQAYELVIANLEKGRRIAYSEYQDAREAPAVQMAVAQAAQLIDESRLHARRAADELDAAEEGRAALDLAAQTRVRVDVARVAVNCRSAVELLLDANGAGSFASGNPLQRVWRDIEVASRHGIINPLMAREVSGRLAVGLGKTVVWGE